MTVVRECDCHQGDVKGIRKACQFMERCEGHGGDVKVVGAVCQLSGSVIVIREV